MGDDYGSEVSYSCDIREYMVMLNYVTWLRCYLPGISRCSYCFSLSNAVVVGSELFGSTVRDGI